MQPDRPAGMCFYGHRTSVHKLAICQGPVCPVSVARPQPSTICMQSCNTWMDMCILEYTILGGWAWFKLPECSKLVKVRSEAKAVCRGAIGTSHETLGDEAVGGEGAPREVGMQEVEGLASGPRQLGVGSACRAGWCKGTHVNVNYLHLQLHLHVVKVLYGYG